MAKPQKLPSGKWRIQIRKGGVYRSKTFTKKTDVTAWAQAIGERVEQIESVGYIQPKGLTLNQLIDLYLESTKGKSAGRSERFSMEKIRQVMGKMQVAKLNPITVMDFVDSHETEGAGGVTIAVDLSYLAALLKWAKVVSWFLTHRPG